MSVKKIVRKSHRSEPVEDTRTLKKIAREASRYAVKANTNKGLSVAFLKDGVIFVSQGKGPANPVSTIKADRKKLKLDDLLCQG